ncbi:MAG: hypothetical protein A2563_01300 [Candidatus Magasanikbacteria bacterium RIFOXYD1_FULL_40_23]|uniref:Uncharacterized protein n=1 Tax=Candidatus Magasanikbacteria bacterium RIFOXYD1_FULL_40_23 TaxID=1798705 RepID=A0A1F6PAL4_9BACT|nr:MAG: hypothetical protein A2563_01300 [Candidatus Magasanikbacteria bacterium RIFOXYD1_FULL_40_23]
MPQDNSWIIILISTALGGFAGWGAAAHKLGRYAQIADDLKAKVGEIEKEIKLLTTNITQCSTKIDERTLSAATALTKRKSPISLTDFGDALLKKSGSDKFVLENQSELVEKIKVTNPKSAYDVQEASKKVIKDMVDEDKFISLKDYAFKEGIELENIILVMSIFLRDVALPLLGYKPEDIDKDDPGTTKE